MGKQVEEEGPKGAPEWVVTFTDMISLLVTFFVLLMTYSSLEPLDYVKIGSVLDDYAGVLSASAGDVAADLTAEALAANTDPMRGAEIPHSRPPEHLYDNLEEMGQKASPDHVAVDLSKMRDGLRIEFEDDAAFEPGSAEISAPLRRSLLEVGEVLQHYSYMIVLEGFTDDRARPTLEYPSAEVLSMHRARNAAQVMLDGTSLPPELVQIAGLGAVQPRASNLTPEGRKLNRRVQLRVLALSTGQQALFDTLERKTQSNLGSPGSRR